MTPQTSGILKKIRAQTRKSLALVRRRVAPGLRTVLGLILVAGGFLGFLPILGFWMIPLGIAIILLDIRDLFRWVGNGGKRLPPEDTKASDRDEPPHSP